MMDDLIETLERHKEKMQDIAYKELYESMAKMQQKNTTQLYIANILHTTNETVEYRMNCSKVILLLDDTFANNINRQLHDSGAYQYIIYGDGNSMLNTISLKNLNDDSKAEFYIVKLEKYQ